MSFKDLYRQLNIQQKLAVDTIEGPVMVVAGPGTGKTQVLTLRIANILNKTHINPENILAITYTEAGVVAMRKRLASIIGPAAYRVSIKTFHGFANSIILDHPQDFSRIIGARSITEVDQIQIIEQLLENGKNLKILRPFGDRFHYLKDIKDAIQKLKRENVSPEKFKELIVKEEKAFSERQDLYHEKGAYKGRMKGEHVSHKKVIEKNSELALIYQRYQEFLTKNRYYDFDDMIMETIRALEENSELLLVLQEQYQYVLVDEHQDTNNAQNKLIELLMNYHDDPNLFMVGDEKQAIFRFQGASLENFKYFQKKYPSAKIISLIENYRSTQVILDAASSLMTDSLGLKSQSKTKKPILFRTFSSTDAELYGLAQDIKEKIKSGVPPEEVAVLYRTNREGQPLERILKKLGIGCRLESDQDILNHQDVRKIVMIFDALNRFGEPEAFVPLAYLDIFDIEPIEIYKLSIEARKGKTVMEQVANGKSSESFKKLYALLANWKKVEANRGILELFDAVMQESGLLSSILKRSDAIESFDTINIFLEQIRKLILIKPEARLKDFMDHLGRMKEHGLSIRGGVLQSSNGLVRLMNAHRAKGLEFDVVYIINFADKVWGNRWNPEKLPLLPGIYSIYGEISGDDADERNLFYVALTRARKEIIISYAHENYETREQLPSRFISEIKKELIKEEPTDELEIDFKKHRDLLFAIEKTTKPFDKETIKELFKERGFAVTHLNNYLKCPWKYFFLNLLLMPKIQDKVLLFGTAVHESLEDLIRQREQGKKPTKRYLLDRFKFHVSRLPFSNGDAEESLEKGEKILSDYFEENHDKWTGRMIPELNLFGLPLTDDILLSGKIDRIDLKDSKTATVIDYKTGRAKSRNEIEGNTRNADGDIKRQLVFYKLLLDRYENGKKYLMDTARVDFVEHLKSELFHIQPDEVKALEKLIKEKASEILALKFWNKECGDKDCEYCSLRRMMK